MIKLFSLHHRGGHHIGILGKYLAIKEATSHLPGINYTRTHRCWYVPFDSATVKELRELLSQLDDVEIDIPELTEVEVPSSYAESLIRLRYSDATRLNYVTQFRKFLQFVYPLSADTFEERDVHRYLLHLIDKENASVSTQNIAINSIKFYLEHVKKGERRTYYIDRPRKETKLPTVLAEEEVRALLLATPNLKHRCIMIMLYASGLRVGELISLRLTDLDAHRMIVNVRLGKGRKDRITLLSKVALETIRQYLQAYKPGVWLFEGEEGGQYSQSSINKMIHRCADKAGITKNVSAHTLRHSFATHMLEQGTDLRYIQSLLGHESSKTTERYTQVTWKGFERLKSPLDSLNLGSGVGFEGE